MVYLELENELNKFVKFIFVIMLLLVAAHICMLILKFVFAHPSVYGLSSLFNLDAELNISQTQTS